MSGREAAKGSGSGSGWFTFRIILRAILDREVNEGGGELLEGVFRGGEKGYSRVVSYSWSISFASTSCQENVHALPDPGRSPLSWLRLAVA